MVHGLIFIETMRGPLTYLRYNLSHSVSSALVCFTNPFSLNYSPQLSQACFQLQNISYPQLLSPQRFS